jgi:hypothetical protein
MFFNNLYNNNNNNKFEFKSNTNNTFFMEIEDQVEAEKEEVESEEVESEEVESEEVESEEVEEEEVEEEEEEEEEEEINNNFDMEIEEINKQEWDEEINGTENLSILKDFIFFYESKDGYYLKFDLETHMYSVRKFYEFSKRSNVFDEQIDNVISELQYNIRSAMEHLIYYNFINYDIYYIFCKNIENMLIRIEETDEKVRDLTNIFEGFNVNREY